MLTCKSCGKTKSADAFPKNNISTCKSCRKAYEAAWRSEHAQHVKSTDRERAHKWRLKPESREKERVRARKHAAKHRQKNLDYAKRRQAERRAFVNTFKDAPCTDCGVVYPPYVMDFDHVDGEKVDNISTMLSRSMEVILEEIAKCDLVCANCHRERTYKRQHNVVSGLVHRQIS